MQDLQTDQIFEVDLFSRPALHWEELPMVRLVDDDYLILCRITGLPREAFPPITPPAPPVAEEETDNPSGEYLNLRPPSEPPKP